MIPNCLQQERAASSSVMGSSFMEKSSTSQLSWLPQLSQSGSQGWHQIRFGDVIFLSVAICSFMRRCPQRGHSAPPGHLCRNSSSLCSWGFSRWFLIDICKPPIWWYYLPGAIYCLTWKLSPFSSFDSVYPNLCWLLQWGLPSEFLLDFFEHPIWWYLLSL